MSTAKSYPCEHLIPAPELEILWVLDSHLQPTDGYAACTHCDARYLFEMFDSLGAMSLFRLARLDSGSLALTLRALRQGSCDIHRARAETTHLATLAAPLNCAALMRQGRFVSIHTIPGDIAYPANRSWRELPCDGAWFKRLCVQT